MEETCMNCEYNNKGGLMKGALITMLYFQTGRADELPEDKEMVNVRMFCEQWKEKTE